MHRLALGHPLDEVRRDLEDAVAFAQAIGFNLIAIVSSEVLHFIRALQGLTPGLAVLGDDEAEEERFAQVLATGKHLGSGRYWRSIHKVMCLHLNGDHAEAVARTLNVEPALTACLTVYEEADLNFYAGLARAGCASEAPPGTAPIEALKTNAARLARLAADNPSAFTCRARLLAAEIARLDGQEAEAQSLYEQAIASARAQGLPHDEAVALETAARYYMARGLQAAAYGLLRSARGGYQRWGAYAKVRQLDRSYPRLRDELEPSPGALVSGPLAHLDLTTVVRAAQAISAEIDLDQLIETLLRLAMEQAGADRAALLLYRNGALERLAEAVTDHGTVKVSANDPGEADRELPQSVLNYAIRTRTSVITDDAAASDLFGNDDYVRTHKPGSVLCVPLLKQTQLVGLMYLENRLTPHAFSAQSTALLEHIAGQAAISLENARLYADLRDQEARVRRLLESNLIGIFFWDFSGRIVTANDAFLEMVGYSQQDLAQGRIDWRQMTPEAFQPLDRAMGELVSSSGRCPAYEKAFNRQDGTSVPVLIGSGSIEGSGADGVAFVLDLTERKQAEKERDARRQAEAASQAKSDFLASMSHELRTPLNGILGYAQILAREPDLNERERRGVDVIQKSGAHLLTLINDLLDLAKIEAGKLDLGVGEIALGSFLIDISDIVAVSAHERGIDLVCVTDPALPRAVRGDELRLRQVLLNLLGNAVKFTDHGEVRLTVNLTPNGRLKFEVADTGIGIATDELETIFQPFDQVGDAARRATGTGMGLAISRRIVRLMGGDILVESRPGEGCRFWFELDLPITAPKTVSISRPRMLIGYQGTRRRVLVVDDDAMNRAVLSDLMTPLGFTVAEASSGREALESAKSWPPDLILTDHVMADLDGHALARELRKIPFLAGTPLIVLSARASHLDERAGLDAGANTFLPKPIEVNKLLDLIGDILGLGWVEAPASPDEDVAAPDRRSIPPREELEALHELALRGVMGKIVHWADRIDKLDRRYAFFTGQLRVLAEQFQSKAILQLVERHLTDMGD